MYIRMLHGPQSVTHQGHLYIRVIKCVISATPVLNGALLLNLKAIWDPGCSLFLTEEVLMSMAAPEAFLEPTNVI